ncbi:MAG: hypothetical protein DVB28_001760 [Verrucomicrobia bacterium]|nr:MAG: hypothetical protein DVB28_001760 [Verrucomicrobiota bacterium]
MVSFGPTGAAQIREGRRSGAMPAANTDWRKERRWIGVEDMDGI